jgi:hypothetical protein
VLVVVVCGMCGRREDPGEMCGLLFVLIFCVCGLVEEMVVRGRVGEQFALISFVGFLGVGVGVDESIL